MPMERIVIDFLTPLCDTGVELIVPVYIAWSIAIFILFRMIRDWHVNGSHTRHVYYISEMLHVKVIFHIQIEMDFDWSLSGKRLTM